MTHTLTSRLTPVPSTPEEAPSSRYDLFVFGDSLSDIGRFFAASGGTIPVSPPYASGRFSNGPVAVEYLAPKLGLNLSLNTNFAIGGALSGSANLFDRLVPVPLGGLLNQVTNFKDQAASLGADADDLYLIWAGGNDFLNLSSNPTPDVINTAVSNAVNNIAAAVSSLAQSGAKNIVVAQTPNLGRVPQSINAGLQQPLTTLSIAFNSALATTLNGLEPTLNGANIILSDLFPPLENVAQNPAAFALTNVTSGYLASALNPTPLNPSADPNQFFFWDQVHPTTRPHSLFADVFEQSIISGITANLLRAGTATNNTVIGFSGNDNLVGLQGNDTLEGNPGNDILNGGQGNDTLLGGKGSDGLFGLGGRDRLIGIDPSDPLLGQEEIDTLQGGLDRDLFVLGDQQGVFYNDGADNLRGISDYARIADLGSKDKIQLAGKLNDYVIRRTPTALSSGVGIYLKTSQQQELIGIVSNTSDVSFVTRTIRTVEIAPPIGA